MTLPCDVVSSFLQILEDVPCARSVTVAMLLRHGEYDQLLSLDVDPVDHNDAWSFWLSKQATDLLRKNVDLPVSIDPTLAAEETFLEAEKHCFQTNEYLDKFLHNGPFGPKEIRIANFFDDVKRLIKRILGPVPLLEDGIFGPGSTMRDKGRSNTIPHKLENRPQFTPNSWTVLSSYSATLWRRGRRDPLSCDYVTNGVGPDPICVPGNRFVTVPKNAKTDRGIAVEPSLNVFYQLPVGSHIKRRLRRYGVDLFHGQDVHREKARQASLDSSLSTIDLSMASDTLSLNLVKLLLPSEWWDYLSALRSPKTLFRGNFHVLSKFSSMGNGFTFELESLIFYCLCKTVVDDSGGGFCSVYGDDIIVPSEASESVLSVLRYCGFIPNGKKTFTSSYFRESCGGEFFNGTSVSTVSIVEFPTTPQDRIILHNNLKRVDPTGFTFSRSCARLRRETPLSIRRCKGPSSLGDLVFHSDGWTTKWKNSIRYVQVYAPVPRKKGMRSFSKRTRYASLLLGIPSSGFSPRGWVSGYKLKWVACS